MLGWLSVTAMKNWLTQKNQHPKRGPLVTIPDDVCSEVLKIAKILEALTDRQNALGIVRRPGADEDQGRKFGCQVGKG